MAPQEGQAPAGGPTVRPEGRGNDWCYFWFSGTIAAALLVTLVDAALLQRKWNYFTGGFLSVDYVQSLSQAAAFLAGSLVADLAVLAPLFIAAAYVVRFLRLHAWVTWVLAVAISVTPLLVADLVSYSVLSFLGDAFDLSLTFQATGGSVAEVLAVSDAHLEKFLWAGAAAVTAAVIAVWMLMRWAPRGARLAPTVDRPTRVIGLSTATFVAGSVGVLVLRMLSPVADNGLKRKPSAQVLSLGVASISDVDRDGYGLLGRIRDPAPFDGRIFPYAIDTPGNGVDEDGLAGDLPACVVPYVESPPHDKGWVRRPNLLLIMLESVRADVPNSRFAGRAVMPEVAALAAAGVALDHAYSHNGFTVQSRKHVFSGTVRDRTNGTSLIDDFNANGYQTAYFSAQDESFGGPDGDIGFARASVSYDARADVDKRYTSSTTPGSLAVPYSVLLSRVAAFLEERTDPRPLFLYVNFHDTHFPYHHRGIRSILPGPVLSQGEIVPERRNALRAMYLNTVANVDFAIGEVLRRTNATLGAEPAVVLTSDHGEGLFDEGFLGHGYELTDVQTRIPLIVSNLPVKLVEPFVQSDLRGAIGASLMTPLSQDAAPQVIEDKAREVFQYIGTVERPEQIGFTRLDGRMSYDFRSRKVQVGSGGWVDPSELPAPEAGRFLRLVHTWERLMLKSSKSPAGAPLAMNSHGSAGPCDDQAGDGQ